MRASTLTPGLNRLLIVIVVLSVVSAVSSAQGATGQPDSLRVLTTARAAHSLTVAESMRAYPVHLRGVVTYYDPFIDPRHTAIFVRDSTGSIFVTIPSRPILPIQAGSVVDVTGVTGPGDFAPIVDRGNLSVMGMSRVPEKAPRVSLTRLLTGAEDGQWVEVGGVVRSVRHSGKHVILELSLSDGTITATTVMNPAEDYARLVDAKVHLHANAAPFYNQNRQMTGARLYFPTLAEVKIEELGPDDPFAMSIRPINSLMRYVPDIASGHRVRVRGIVTLQRPGRLLCIEDATQGLCVQTAQDTR